MTTEQVVMAARECLSSKPAPHTLERAMFGALARIQTWGLSGHYSECSIGLSYERITGKEGFEPLAVSGQKTNSHRLSRIRRIFLNDEFVGDLALGESSSKRAKICFIARVERNSIGACGMLLDDRLAGSVDELSGLGAERKVGSDDAVVRQIRRVNDSWVGV